MKTLYAAGVRKIYSSIVGALAVTSQGQLGLPVVGETGLFQTLKERNDGFDVAIGEGSQILDANGNVLSTITSMNGGPALTFASGQSLKTLYEAGLRFFYYKFEPNKDKVKLHEVKIVKGETGEFRLE